MSAHTAPAQPASPDMREAQWQLPHNPRSAKHARALLRPQLTDWKITGEVADTAELLLSELVTNSIRHARTPPGREIGLRFATYDGRLRVEVADASDRRPQPRKAAPEDEGAGDSPSSRPWRNAGDAAPACTASGRRHGRSWACHDEHEQHGDTAADTVEIAVRRVPQRVYGSAHARHGEPADPELGQASDA